MGDSKRPLVFVVGCNMGAFGAALATVMGQAFSFVVSIIYLYRHRVAFGFDFRPQSFVPSWNSMKLLLRLGAPMALQFSAITVSMMYVNSLINVYGVAAAAVTGVGSKLDSILRVVANSMGTAGSAMVAQSMGAGKKERVSKVVNCILIVCQSYALVCCLIVFFFPKVVFGLFNTDPEVLALAPLYRGVAVVTYASFGLRAAYNSVVNGIGFASLGLVSGLMDGVVARIGLALLFGTVLGYGILGFWYGSAAAGFVSAAIVGIYYYSGKWKTFQLITEK
jgi:Na+-driven multidrug efflux pump